jgi:ethanolamine transporter
VAVISVGLAIATWEFMTETQIMPAGWELAPVTDGIEIIGFIAMMLLGAFPAVYVIIKVAHKPLSRAGRVFGMSDVATGGMIATLANNIPMFQILKDMDPRGKVLNCAFAVSAAFTFGDHLGFTAAVERSMIMPMIVGKLVAGVSALGVALLFFSKTYPSGRTRGGVTAEGTVRQSRPPNRASQSRDQARGQADRARRLIERRHIRGRHRGADRKGRGVSRLHGQGSAADRA